MQRFKKIAGTALKYGAFAWLAALFVWYFIVSTLRNGISCDEGYYLMGYLRHQSIEGIGTDFHAIVRAICRSFPDDDIMVFRYVRLFLSVIAIVFFAISSYGWLSRRKGIRVSRCAYYPMIALAGAMSFTFAAPTISYDSIEHFAILSSASLMFILFSTKKVSVQSICAFGIGFLLWFACSNYPPAGVCMVILFAVIYILEESEKKWYHFPIAFLGVLMAILISHFFIHDMKEWFSGISKVFVSTFTEESLSRHDAGSLVSTMLLVVAKLIVIFVPLVTVLTLVYKKIHVPDKLQWAIILLLCVFLIVFRKIYELRSILLMVPVALMLAKVLAKPNLDIKGYLLSKDAFIALIIIAIPIAGVFGTNQPILKKAVIYAPFWVLAFHLVFAELGTKDSERLSLLFTTILLAGYVWLGNFQRYHYYYTPRSSRYEIVGASRPQSVLVSQYQQQYYKDLLDILKESGCKPDDSFMAFGENQMAVYLAGGYIDGRLPYHWWQYKHFESEAPQAFVLFKNEENDVISYFRKAGWGFPEDYERKEMRQMAENLGDDYRTVIYVKTKR